MESKFKIEIKTPCYRGDQRVRKGFYWSIWYRKMEYTVSVSVGGDEAGHHHAQGEEDGEQELHGPKPM